MTGRCLVLFPKPLLTAREATTFRRNRRLMLRFIAFTVDVHISGSEATIYMLPSLIPPL